MCGIAGIVAVGPEARGTLDVSSIAATMTSELMHRGPDAGGIWKDPDGILALGHRRLAIVDLSPRGTQPMRRAGSPLVITFNGEIYNFRKLRSGLEAQGVIFDSATDTETILAAVEAWGLDEALKRMEGAFAFCIWDGGRRVLHLARDRTGQKPLYLCMARQHLLFSSELRSLQASGLTSGKAAREAISAYLAYGYVPEPMAMIEGVCKLPPGSSLTLAINATKAPENAELLRDARRFWNVPDVSAAERVNSDIGQSVRVVDELLTEIVAEQLECDVPVGVFLSGGIDSSIVAAKVKQVSRRAIGAYTVRFPDAQFDESTHAAKIAGHLGMKHHIIELGAAELLSCVQAESPRLDEPTANPSYFPLQLMSRHARQQVTVALSGDGGDEVFSGYNRYRALQKLFRIRSRSSVRKACRSAIDGLLRHDKLLSPFEKALATAIPQANPRGSLERLQRFFAADTHGSAYRGVMQAIPPSILATLVEGVPAFHSRQFDASSENWLRRMMQDDMAMYLPGDNLAKVDRASMREALEVRLPLLDLRLIEAAARLPDAHLLSKGRTKLVLRKLLDHYLPRNLIERPKMGFSVPIEKWLMTELRPWAESALANPLLHEWAGVAPEGIKAVWGEFQRSNGKSNGRAVWALAVLSAWIGASIGARGGAGS